MRRALALSMLVSACSASSLGEFASPPTWDAYDGVAFPEYRAPIVLPEGDFALAPSTFTDTVWLADLGAQQVVATRPVGRSPVLVDGPHQIVANMAARLAYVLSAYPPDLLGAPAHSGGDAGARALLFFELEPSARRLEADLHDEAPQSRLPDRRAGDEAARDLPSPHLRERPEARLSEEREVEIEGSRERSSITGCARLFDVADDEHATGTKSARHA